MTFRTTVFALLLLAVVAMSSISPAQESALDRGRAATPNICGSQSRSRGAQDEENGAEGREPGPASGGPSDCQKKRDQCTTRCPRVDEAYERCIRECHSMRC